MVLSFFKDKRLNRCFSLKLNSVDFYKAKEGVNYITRASGSGKNPAVILSVNSYSARFQKFYHIFVGKSKKWPVQKFPVGYGIIYKTVNIRGICYVTSSSSGDGEFSPR